MSPRRLLLSGVALLALGSVANASEVPAPCGPDPRERCVNYRPGQIVRVYLAPGATVTIELPASESIFFVGVSDDGVIRGTGSSDRVASGSDATADPNLMTAVPVGGDKDHKFTQFLTLKALHHLEPRGFHDVMSRFRQTGCSAPAEWRGLSNPAFVVRFPVIFAYQVENS